MINSIIDEDTLQIINENNGLHELYDKTIMVTGASGMIGSYIVYTLIKLNEEYNANIKIVPLIRDLCKLHEEVISKEYVYPIIQDVSDEIKCCYHVDYVIHCAGPSSPKIIKENPVETNFANTLGTANTLLFAKKNNCEGYLFISSREIYGDPINNEKYFTEEDLGYVNHLIPRNSYAEGKKAGENMCIDFKREYGLNTKIVRLTHTYGPSMSIDDGKVQADFLKNIINKEDIILKSDGSSIRIYLYISDAISAIFKILLKSKDMVYNVSDERNEVSIRELAETIINIYPAELLNLKFQIDDRQLNDDMEYAPFKSGVLSSKKLKNEFDWNAKYSVKEGFKRTIDFFKEEMF